MQTAPPRYRKVLLPEFGARAQEPSIQKRKDAWVQALPALGFNRVFDQEFITLDSQLSWLNDTHQGRNIGWRKQPQKLWIQVWRHDAGALSSVVRFSEGAEWMYSAVNLSAMASHGFVSTETLRGYVLAADGTVCSKLEGSDRDANNSLEDVWQTIRQRSEQGRLVPIEHWDAIPLPEHLMETVVEDWGIQRREAKSVDTPAARHFYGLEKTARRAPQILEAWSRRIDQFPSTIPDAERGLWIEHIKQRLEEAFKNCFDDAKIDKEKLPGMRALVDEFELRAECSPAIYRRNMLKNSLHGRLVSLMQGNGMTDGDPLYPQERATTTAWLAALLDDDQGGSVSTLATAESSELPRFSLRFQQFLFAAARDVGVINKIKSWIQTHEDSDLVQACTVPDKNGMTLPMNLARAWMQAVNARHCQEEQNQRINTVRECFHLLSRACLINDWTWTTDKASAWDPAMGEAINLPFDEDLVGPHQERLESFFHWAQQSGARVPGVVFIPGVARAVDLTDSIALAGAINEGIQAQQFNCSGSAAERIELIAPLSAMLVHAKMNKQVRQALPGPSTRTVARF